MKKLKLMILSYLISIPVFAIDTTAEHVILADIMLEESSFQKAPTCYMGVKVFSLLASQNDPNSCGANRRRVLNSNFNLLMANARIRNAKCNKILEGGNLNNLDVFDKIELQDLTGNVNSILRSTGTADKLVKKAFSYNPDGAIQCQHIVSASFDLVNFSSLDIKTNMDIKNDPIFKAIPECSQYMMKRECEEQFFRKKCEPVFKLQSCLKQIKQGIAGSDTGERSNNKSGTFTSKDIQQIYNKALNN